MMVCPDPCKKYIIASDIYALWYSHYVHGGPRGVVPMKRSESNQLKVPLIILLSLLLVFNLQVAVPTAEGTDEVKEDLGETRVLTDDEIAGLGLNPPDAPTRSEPWRAWKRFHYPSGGENGATVHAS